MASDKKVTVTAKVTPVIEKKLKAEAKKKDRGVSYIINQVLTNYFAKS